MQDELDRALACNPDYPPGFGLWELCEPDEDEEDEEPDLEDLE